MLLMIAALAAVVTPVQATQPDQRLRADLLEGEWRTSQMEMAGALKLMPGGRFRYALSYGAADEVAEGRWELRGDRIALTSDPMPVPPAFVLLKDEPAPAGELWVKLDPPGFGFQLPLELWLGYADLEPELLRTDSDGQVRLGTLPYPKTLVPQLPIYGGEVAGRVGLDPAHGHRVTFRFVPNDLGKVAFKGEQLMIDGETLSMNRFDTGIRFRKVTP
ncbi:hypothetical protein M8312_07850 [Sphingomonas sp. KRR8]|uniref:hypothetical protein n=1 Tax=Sphingomonas sp. KRR8 TaxID=2942996 RepID=UPI0020201299|nr:hypothetical protein [Sphingomonas sp. KRR8]URD59737.1 hypothetical protein M8312_07850 [Sphingomonas sp. KRR8]